jgi:hypothetical protein
MASQQTLENEETKVSVIDNIAFLTSLIHLIRKVTDLGYLNQDLICRIGKPLVKVFLPFLCYKEKVSIGI